MQQIGLRLDDDLLAIIDRQRGDIPREVFIRRVLAASTEQIENALDTAVSLGIQAVVPRVEAPGVSIHGPGGAAESATSRRVHQAHCGCPVCKPPKKEKT